MTEKHFVVATAGHVDHGKSALVKALTGTDPDRLPEEKAREITIDLGFAHLHFSPNGSDTDLSISIIDVPGHEDFVRNMIAGLGSIDLALLVVAADDGWMPQTEEHFQILSYLRVPKILVALNKSDLADPHRATEQITEKLLSTPYAGSQIVAVSARSGAGIPDLKRTLGVAMQNAQPQIDFSKPRLFIDRAFTLPGIGPIVTGTLSGGSVAAGSTAFLQPGNLPTRVRSVQTHRAGIQAAKPGMRTGINLSDVPKSVAELSELRGSVLTTERYEASSAVNVAVEKHARSVSSPGASRPLKSGTNVYLHHGTDRIPAVLILANDHPLQPGETALGQLRMAHPILAFAGDRYVLRDRSEQHTIAGGIILETNVTKSLSAGQSQGLMARAENPHDVSVYVETELIRGGPARISELLRNSRFSAKEVEAAVIKLGQSRRIIMQADTVAEIHSWQAIRDRAAWLIDEAHRKNPAQKGFELTELRSAFPQLSAETINALIENLCGNGFSQRGSMIARASHRPSLPTELEEAAKQILKLLTEKLLDPPARAQIASDASRRQATRFLIEHGEVVEISPDLLLSRQGFDRGKQIVSTCLRAKQSATVSELREALGTSRRVAIPLLERLDRDRVTRRIGDRRVLSESTFPGASAPVP